MADKKLGFGGQWVDGTPIGNHVDSDGDAIKIDTAFLEAVVRNYDPKLHEAPVVIGHPKTDAPAYGYVSALRVKDGRLERQLSGVNPEFEEIVKSGAYKKRSDAFYLDSAIAPGGKVPALRHVGFLGAQPPAIKGIQDIHFAEGDAEVKTVDVEVDTAISFSEGDTTVIDKDVDVKKSIGEAVAAFFRDKFGPAKDKAEASFGEADAKAMIDGAVKVAVEPLTTKISALETENKSLRESVDSQVGSSQRAAIVAFCESLPGTILPAMKKMGIVEFMEALDAIPEKKKITVITFAEEGGKEVEKKVEISPLTFFKNFLKALPPIQFGEQFGDVKLTGDGSEVIEPERMNKLRASAGIKIETAKA